MATEISVVSANGGERLDVIGAPMIVKSDDTMPLFFADHIVPPGFMAPPHVHTDDDEVLYILSGELVLIGDDGEAVARAGDSVRLPRGSRHGYRNATEAEARVLVMAVPGRQTGEMFAHFDRAARAGGKPLDPPALTDIAGQYGIRIG